jgi:hypothetical protein
MRMSDLVGADVVGPAGERVAVVTDVRLVADGPPRGLTGNATWRVAGLVLSTRHTGSMLGYDRRTGSGRSWSVRWSGGCTGARGTRTGRMSPRSGEEEHRVVLDVKLADLPRCCDGRAAETVGPR